MNSKSSVNVERVCEANSNIFSPHSTPEGDIFFACQSGEILRHKDGQMKVFFIVKIKTRLNSQVVDNLQHFTLTRLEKLALLLIWPIKQSSQKISKTKHQN